MSWQSRTTVKKGNLGEDLVADYLESKGFIVYEPVTEGSHGFDKLAMKNKRELVYAEVKAKARRKYYPDTGINISHYEDYSYLYREYKMNIFIFFVDELLEEIYGGFLQELRKPVEVNGQKYPLKHKGIIYFPLMNMRRNIAKLNAVDVKELKKYNTRNYSY